jgi:hypothetical protein
VVDCVGLENPFVASVTTAYTDAESSRILQKPPEKSIPGPLTVARFLVIVCNDLRHRSPGNTRRTKWAA